MSRADSCSDRFLYFRSLDSVLILNSIHLGNVSGDVYKSLLHLCVGAIILIVVGCIPGFGVPFLFIDVWERKRIPTPFWIMDMSMGSCV